MASKDPKVELDIEKEFVKQALRVEGCWAIKFKHVGIKGAPDRLVFCPGGHIFFIEFKIGDNTPSPHQEEFAKTLKKLGLNVHFCWTLKQALDCLKLELEYARSKHC